MERGIRMRAPIVKCVERALNIGDDHLFPFNLNKAHFAFFNILCICNINPFHKYAPLICYSLRFK